MLQIVLAKPGEFEALDAPIPPAKEGETLVRVERIGICGTDLHAFAGRQPFFEYPRILGHELAGTVIVTHSGPHGLGPGDRCAIEPYLFCGSCPTCNRGRYNCCAQLQVLGVHVDGGMQEFLAVPTQLLHKSTRLSLDQLALVETLGVGAHAVGRAALQAEETALVVGAGPIGLSVIQFALAKRARVSVLEINQQRREFLAGWNVEILSEPSEQMFDAVFDTTGAARSMERSLLSTAFGGRLTLVGVTNEHVLVDDTVLHRREITVLGSRNSCHEFARIIRMMEMGEIDVSAWITHRMNLAEVPSRFGELSRVPGLVKAMIDVPPG